MGKALKTVGAVIGAAALIATGAGAILMPGMAGTTTLFGVSVGTLNTVSAGLMAVGGMLDKPDSMGSGTPDEWNSNPDQPTPFAFGRVGCSGKIVHRDEYGKDNKLQGIVSVYSGAGPIKSFVSYKVNDLPVSFTSNGGTATGKYNRQMWRSWRLGEQPDTALSLPTGLDEGAVMPAWGPAYRLSGKACELLTVQQDSKFSVYPMGLPTPQAVIEGIYGYDPRYDSTYPGGFGDCRLGVRSTYRWINNPIIAGLNWALGMVENGHVVGGIGASPQGIDMPAFVDAANVADANAWTVSAWPDSSEDVSEVLKQLLQAGGASYARHAGKISCVSRGAAKPSIVTVTGRDTCGPIELDTGASLYNRINTITPSFMSEAHGWKHVPADPVTFEALRTEDGGKRGDQITYRFADNARQAGQLAAYDILDAREPFSGTVPFKPHLRRLKRGDCFVLDEPGFLLDGVKCIVLGRSYNAQIGEVRVSFRSETDGKHPLALGKTTTMPDYPVLTPADPTLVSPPLPDDWVLIPKLPNETGVQLPIIDIIGEVSNSTATAVHFEWTYDNNGVPSADWTSAGIWPPTVKSISVPADPGTWIWIGASYLRGENFSEREPFGPVQVPELVSNDTTHLNGEPVQDILDKLTDVETLSANNALAVADLDGRVEGVITEAEAILAGAEGAAALATLKAGEAEDAASASNVAAGIATTKADEAGNHSSAANAAKLAAEAARNTATDKAAAAVLSASKAEAEANDAETWANASEGSATQAAGSAGQALTYRNQASTARDGAVAAQVASGTNATAAQTAKGQSEAARDAAAGSAATAVTQASNAGAAAASAEISANLAASVGPIGYMRNPSFGDWSAAMPAHWLLDTSNGTTTKQPGLNGRPNSMRSASSGADYGFRQDVDAPTGGEYLVLEAEVTLVSGDMRGAGVFLRTRTIAGANILAYALRFGYEPDASGRDVGSGIAGSRYRFSKLIDARNASVQIYRLYGLTRYNVVGPAVGAATLDWHQLDVRPATPEEIAAGTVLPAVESQLAITAAVAADAANRMASVAFNVTGGAGGDPFDVLLKAGPDGSLARIIATALVLGNIVGGNSVEVLKLIGGEAYFSAPVSTTISGRRLTIGPGFGVSGGLVLWFGPSGTATATMSRTNGYFALGTDGKVYYGNAELGGGGGDGGAAFTRVPILGNINSGTFTTIASASFAGKPASGWWDANVTGLAGSAAGVSDVPVEFRIIESGGASALASGQATVPAGGVPQALELTLIPGGPWAQTRPAGNITLQLQARRMSGTGTANLSGGDFKVNYTPGT